MGIWKSVKTIGQFIKDVVGEFLRIIRNELLRLVVMIILLALCHDIFYRLNGVWAFLVIGFIFYIFIIPVSGYVGDRWWKRMMIKKYG